MINNRDKVNGRFTSAPRTHGNYIKGKRSPTYNSWRAMRGRCDDPNNERYCDYGGRGITYCDRWKEFSNFLEDMGERPKGKTLDRIDSEKNYYKENCKWSSPLEQRLNQRGYKVKDEDQPF